ncbi:MAG: UvrD-helicase domain-containing protein [Gammaproteobacteria bacterium]|nr:UvrD-helicase domain-containing protein [Gammaproteobacteria bacterium]MBT8111544.1 UvrD-helicase domain-containing protein [Gammaproteobacteria bacterium]NND47059.1 UvrD-helicase domain-containing protein [Woeseiaceae bacterium]NNL46242.1 UvrD-helicase domain-containing protein [Woeseiaceae bacterium]
MPDPHLLEDDLQARTDALDISRSFIVQAPAGSGKTELLIQRYLKLLSAVDNPEEVLAITFTRKAAAEMQFRVLAALQGADRGDEPEEEHQKLTKTLAAAALQHDRELGWQLLSNPRRMRIQTLDSLNALIARLRPISSPEGASGARIVTDAELSSLYRAAALATLDWLAESGPMNSATREVLVHVDNNTQVYVSYLEQMLRTRDQWLPFIGSGLLTAQEADELRRRFEQNLETSVTEHLLRTASAFPAAVGTVLSELQDYAAANLRGSGSAADPICALHGLKGSPTAHPNRILEWHGLAELLLTKAGQVRKRVNKLQGFPAGDTGQKAAMHALLEELAEQQQFAELLDGVRALPPVQYSDEQWNVLLALFRLLPLAVTELKRLFAERGVADHTEIALTAGVALGTADKPGDVALLLDYQVRHLLVDEMQDTSSAQYRMLEALTGGWEQGDGRTLYCVGDPMQSIYRFRNAEVGQFLLAKKYGIGNVTLTSLLLRRNFRSGEFLVDWFNTVFPEILAPRDEPSSGAVSYSEAVSVPHLSGVGRCYVHPVFGSNVEQEAELGCKVISETLTQYPEDEIAVLVRGRTQLPNLLAELRKAGIGYRAIEIDRLTDLPEVIEVLALTRAAVHQGDRLAWLAILRAPWIGLDWTDLHALVLNDTESTVWELLQNDKRLASLSEGGRQAVEKSYSVLATLVAPRRLQGLRELVEVAWMTLGGPAILDDEYAVSNVYRYFHVLEKHERCGSLNDVAELESMLDLERVSSDVSARLQVMTMHRAKGLEFEHVLLYGLGRLPGSGNRSVLSWFDVPGEHGAARKVISPVGPRNELSTDPVHRFIELSEARKDRHEQARLLYVACTRARKSLHLIGHTTVTPDGSAFKPPTKRSLLHLLWPALEPQYASAFVNQVAVDAPDDDVWMKPLLRRFETTWTLPPVASLLGTPSVSDTTAEEEEVEFYWVGTEARIAGTIVHRWLYLFAENRATPNPELLTDYRPVTRRWLKEMGIGEVMIESIAERVEGALRSTLADAKGKWIASGDGHAEMALTGVYEGKIESIVLDRVRIDSDGVHWVIDYKTSSHEGGNLAGFLRAETDRYKPQLRKYAAIYTAYAGTDVRCALYFPLLQSFVEVDV